MRLGFLFSCLSVLTWGLTDGFESKNGEDLTDNGLIPPEPPKTYPYYVSSSVPALHDKLYREIINILLDEGVFFNNDSSRSQPPFKFRTPEEIKSLIDLSLPEERVDEAALIEIVKKVIQYSPHVSHPFKVDRHGAGLDPYGLIGDWMGTVMSGPVLTYLLAPVYTLMEYEVERKVRELINYPDGKGDGMITPGAGMGNGYVIQMALQRKFLNFKQKGFIQAGSPKGPRPIIFISEDASFAYEKYCIWEGLGLTGCSRVQTDENGRMDLNALNTAISDSKKQDYVPTMIVGTAGTPVLGAIDNLESLAVIAKREKMWFHVDGQLAGATILSPHYKNRLKGVERSDSFLWSVDKGLSAPFVSTILVTKEERIMKKTFSFNSDLLFIPSPLYNNSKWDNGDNTMQTTRRPDIIKIWFLWKAKGTERLARHVDYTYTMTDFAVSQLKRRPNKFKLILQNFESNQVAFYFKSEQCPYIWSAPTSQEDCIKQKKITETIRENLLKKGKMTISVNTIPSKSRAPVFVMSLANSAITRDDVIYMIDLIEEEGSSQPKLWIPQTEKRFFWPFWRRTTTPKPAGATPLPSSLKIPKAPQTYSDFVSAPIESLHKNFFTDFFEAVLEKGTYFQNSRKNETPAHFESPEDLLKKFDFSLSSPSGTMKENEAALLEIFNRIIKYSVHLGHPYDNYQFNMVLDPYTIMGDYIIAAVNSPMLTYEDNPIFTLMEDELAKAVRKQVGYPEQGDGLVLPGGSAANQVAMMLALLTKETKAKESGNSEANTTLVAFLSIAAHYSTNKGAFFSGIGQENAVYVAQDESGKMSVADLREKVAEAKAANKTPFLVVATAGTTTLGAFDPLNEIADVCRDNKMWLHVDGAYGGSSILSSNAIRKARQFTGIERSDSFNFNPHKSFGAAQDASFFVTRHKGILRKVAPPISEQEFNNKQLYDSSVYDTGFYQPFPDRRSQVFKTWFLWKAKGLQGLGAHIDAGYTLIDQVYEYLQMNSDRFILVHPKTPPECTTVNFYYVPERLRANATTMRNDPDFIQLLQPVQRQILNDVVISNRLTISYKPAGDIPACLILSTYNSASTLADMVYMLKLIDHYGKNL
ncbi:unnamed protein product [Allacma fusca]|uniref:Glutamate decarboxylase n=1 Tax=Allacma fusca TaxID=39272 RepID=A0A8J2JRX7_9HEXA|nr:unnamed protein product [Allacma fusca]